jgi:hypothetical protein
LGDRVAGHYLGQAYSGEVVAVSGPANHRHVEIKLDRPVDTVRFKSFSNWRHRSPAHNKAVDGAPRSKHMDGTAFDISMANHDPVAFEAAARAVGFLGFGTYPRSNFMHIDLGPARSWGPPFPPRAVPFAREAPPAREVLAQSRTLRGTGAAGVATVGAAGVEVARDALAEAQSAVLPLVPYLDSLRWLFIALALGGIAVAVWARLDDWKRGQR